MIKRYLLIILFIITAFASFCQTPSDLDRIAESKIVMVSDMADLFLYAYGQKPSEEPLETLAKLSEIVGIDKERYKKDAVLTYGVFSEFAIKYIKYDGGLFYRVTHAGRYAVRDLSFIGILPLGVSEYSNMSGSDLLMYIKRVAEYEKD